MPRRNHRKRALLFLAAVLLPSAVLVGTTLHLIRQERELAVRRTAEERALLALRIGQELLGELRRLGDRVLTASLSPQDIHALTRSEPAVLTVAAVEDGRLVFPWETPPGPSSAPNAGRLARYQRLVNRGGEAEYRQENLAEAARLYRQAAEVLEEDGRVEASPPEAETGSSRVRPALIAEARVHQARALLRAHRTEEAQAVFRLLAEAPPSLADGEGMPFSIYGLEGLHRSGATPEDLLALLRETLDSAPHLALPALLAWRDVARGILDAVGEAPAGELGGAVEEVVSERKAVLESLENLRRDFPGLLATARGGSGAGDNPSGLTWLPYGREPWLVGILADAEGAPARVAVARPALLLGSTEVPREEEEPRSGDASELRGSEEALQRDEAGTGVAFAGDETLRTAWRTATLLPAGEGGGESLGPALNGLRLSFPPGFPPPPERGGVEGWFFRLLLPIILILTGFTAYLAWRDVRREADAVRLRSRFVSSVTHELKTPLTSIRMFAETLRLGRHSSPEAQREYLDTVVHETERLSRLINNVLDFARIERGEKTYHMASTDVGVPAREAARAVAYPLAQGRYTLTTEIAEDLPLVEGDADALTQALLNLLSNAMKFSKEGSRIDLRVFRDGGELLLQVEDQGRGIAPRDRESIFRDFFRTADAEREGIPGTGLGLPLVTHVATAHGGRVEVESEVGRGSTFTIRIPVPGRTLDKGREGGEKP